MKLLTIFISEYILYFCVYQLRHPPLNKNKTQTISVVTFVGSLLNSTLQPLVNWKNLINILTPWFQPILWNYFTVYPNLKFCFLKKQVCCYAKASPYVLPKIGFIPPPYCQLMRNNGGLLTEPQKADQTRSLSCCGMFPYSTSFTAFHLTQTCRTHRALFAHSL